MNSIHPFNDEILPEPQRKREWVLTQAPTVYEMSCDKCGGTNITWSEFEGMIWCYDCEVDTRGNGGLFDGPIAVHLCEELGIRFDRLYLKEWEIRKARFDYPNGRTTYEPFCCPWPRPE